MQTDLFPPKTDWKPLTMLPNWENAEAVVIDLETYDPNLKTRGAGWAYNDGKVIGFAIKLVQGEKSVSYYLPIDHQTGRNLDKGLITDYVKDICGAQIPKVFHNALYDMGWLSTLGCEVRGPIFDTMVGAALLDENRKSYGLDQLAKDWCGVSKDEQLLKEAASVFRLKNPKGDMWKLPPEYVGPYAEGDVDATYALWLYEKEHIAKGDLQKIVDLEMGLIPLLLEMRKRGVRVDIKQAHRTKEDIQSKLEAVNSEITRRFGGKVDVWASASIAKAFDNEGLDYPRTAKTAAPSFQKEWLEAHPHDLPKMILRARRLDKLINTFLDGMVIGHSHKGRIHPELHQLKSDEGGTVSGRFSCSNPNLQQVSARDPELAPLIRGLFLPEEGDYWGALDYSSQEPRLTVHYAHLMKQKGAAEAVDGYNKDARMDYHQMVADIASITRKHAKTINLGLAYGMGEVKLCENLGLPTMMETNAYGKEREVAGEEGRKVLDTYHEKVPFVAGLSKTCARKAADRGWIRTAGGRLCRFDFWAGIGSNKLPIRGRSDALEAFDGRIKRAYTHKALNRLIQGSAADMTKLAMLEMWNQGIVPMLTMHDEIDISVNTEAQWKLCEEIMVEALPLTVPTVVDCEFGRNWGEATYSWEEVLKL